VNVHNRLPGRAAPAVQGKAEEELVRTFTVSNADYYAERFARIRNRRGIVWSFNWAAALGGPVWAAARGVTILFWLVFCLQVFAAVQISVGSAGNLGAPEQARATRLTAMAESRARQAKAAEAAGAANAAGLKNTAAALDRSAAQARNEAARVRAKGPLVLAGGIASLLIGALVSGLLGNLLLEKRFSRWRSRPEIGAGRKLALAVLTGCFCAASYALAAYRFAAASPFEWLAAAPANRNAQAALASMLDGLMSHLSNLGGGFFGAISAAIAGVIDAFGFALAGMPWPVTMSVILLLAWQLAGPRVAIFTAAALAYLALLGFWEKSLETVALLGTAATLCLLVGIPLGIWCGRRARVYAAVRPVLDFMQTMPAFVYLIPVIALFGIGKPPGVIATLIFGTPPIVRLTALGLQGVPPSVREAAQAYGATRWFLLTRVDLPLAMPSIMTGVNQTILMCLSMVVIASLIGAKGLGEDVLNALQYAAVGQGLLAGLAILLCAMIIDRIVQGRHGSQG